MGSQCTGTLSAGRRPRTDERALGGLNMDGTFFGGVLEAGLDKPFFVMGAGSHDGVSDPSWATVWSGLRGWKRHVQLVSGEHMTYSDFPALIKLRVVSGGLFRNCV